MCKYVRMMSKRCVEAPRGPDKGGAAGEGITWEPYPGPAVERGALKGTGVGLIPIHPVLHSPGQGTIRPARLPLRLHGDL